MKFVKSSAVLAMLAAGNAFAGVPTGGVIPNPGTPVVNVDEPGMLPLFAIAAIALFVAKRFKK